MVGINNLVDKLLYSSSLFPSTGPLVFEILSDPPLAISRIGETGSHALPLADLASGLN